MIPTFFPLKNDIKKHAVLICILLSLLFLILATMRYPGGSISDKTSIGFQWSKNFFSNLFLPKALNGAANPARIWAIFGMFFNAIGYALFFIHTAKKIPHKHTTIVLKSIGLINMVFTFLIASPLHDVMVTLSSTLSMLGLFYITVFIIKTKRNGLKLFSIISLLTFYATLFVFGTGNWELLAILQKISFLLFILLVLTIEYSTSAKDFQVDSTNKTVPSQRV